MGFPHFKCFNSGHELDKNLYSGTEGWVDPLQKPIPNNRHN